MRKLLSANFVRLWKSKVFWALEITSLFFSVVLYFLVGVNVKNIGESWILKNANYYFFLVMLYTGVLTAIFSSLFFGTEHSEGTLRNKLIVGHRRRDVYFSNWFLNAMVTFVFVVTHYLTAVTFGIFTGGKKVILVIEQPFLKIGCSLFIALAYAAVFTMTSMLDSNKARCAVNNILLALFLLLAGFMVFSALEQPETKMQMVMQEDGSYIKDIVPNTRYVDGNLRTVYTIIESVMPAAFALRLAVGRFSMYHIWGCFLLIVVFTVTGAAVFNKKDTR